MLPGSNCEMLACETRFVEQFAEFVVGVDDSDSRQASSATAATTPTPTASCCAVRITPMVVYSYHGRDSYCLAVSGRLLVRYANAVPRSTKEGRCEGAMAGVVRRIGSRPVAVA